MTTIEQPTPTRVAHVPFQGRRGGRWPVTVGQGNVLDWMVWDPGPAIFSVDAGVPAGHRVEDVVQAVGVLVSRHEGLRTHYSWDTSGERSQTVVAAGQFEVLVLELGEQARQRTQVTEPYRAFDHSAEYPLRVAVALDLGTPVRAIFEFSHLAADLVAATIVLAEFAELLAAPAQHRRRPPAWQPADQAEHERTPAVARRLARAFDYWCTQVAELPPCMLSVPARTPGPPEFTLTVMRSGSVAVALRELSVRAMISPATIIVAAITTLLSWWTDNPTLAADIIYSNRSLPRMHDYVGTVVQSALLGFRRTSSSFHETLLATHSAILNAYKFAHFDATAIAQLVESAGQRRGCPRHRDLVINDLSSSGGEVFVRHEDRRTGADAGATEVRCGLAASRADPVAITILRIQPTTLLGIEHDARCVSDADAVALLRATERLIVTAANRDIDLDRLGEFLELEPASRGEGWLRLAAGWVDLPTCERAFREVTGDPAARVFAEHGEVVGYTTRRGWSTRLAQLHAAAIAGLGGRHGAITPDRYVICAQAPQSPESPAAWQAQPTLMVGPGR